MDISNIITLIFSLCMGGVPTFFYFKENRKTAKANAKIAELTATKDEMYVSKQKAQDCLDIQQMIDTRLEMYEKNRISMMEMLASSHKEVLGHQSLVTSLRVQLSESQDRVQQEKKEKYKLINELKEIKEQISKNKSEIELLQKWVCKNTICTKRNK